MELIIAIALLPLFPALLPRRWAFLGFAIFALLIGLLWLDLHVQPFDNTDFGFGQVFVAAWAIVLAAGLAIVLIRIVVMRLVFRRPQSPDQPVPAALWPFPIGLLLAVFFMHWASNRLAGASPAWMIHIGAASLGLGTTWILWRFLPAPGVCRDVYCVGLAGTFFSVVWVVVAALEAQALATRAKESVADLPYCMLSFAGRDHPRPARAVLELSRLVSRSGGRAAQDDVYWLIVQRPDGLIAKRPFSIFPLVPPSAERPQTTVAACVPMAGGNLG